MPTSPAVPAGLDGCLPATAAADFLHTEGRESFKKPTQEGAKNSPSIPISGFNLRNLQ